MKLSQIAIVAALGLGLISVVPVASAEQDLPCLSKATGGLTGGKFIENGVCVDESVWYFKLSDPPIATNGLHAGSPTHFQLLFGSIGKPTQDAPDPQNSGLNIEGGKGNLTIELSKHFIYDQVNQAKAQPLTTTELATGPANLIFPSPCAFDPDTVSGKILCSGWISQHGTDKNTIIVVALDGLFGKRAKQVGLKFFHLHPRFTLEREGVVYFNANGTCDDGLAEPTYCRIPFDCGHDNETACIPATEPFTASITATLYNKDGDIQHKGTRFYTFETDLRYQVAPSNTGLVSNEEVAELVNFQRVEPGTNCSNLDRFTTFSDGSPYAPRFFLIGPNFDDNVFQPRVPNATMLLTTPTTGLLLDNEEQIGSFSLMQPSGANGQILEENLGFTRHANSRIGGSVISIPVQVGDIPGKYIVKIVMEDGRSAESVVIVPEGKQTSTACRGMRTSIKLILLAAALAMI